MKEYQLTTIKDIFDKIPPDRIDVLMAELTTIIKRAQAVTNLMKVVSKDVTGKEIGIVFPDTITWNDDGKGSIKIHIQAHKKTLMTVEETIKEKK